MKAKFTAVLRREGDEYVALNPELDIASQGLTPEQALANLREAVGLFWSARLPMKLRGA